MEQERIAAADVMSAAFAAMWQEKWLALTLAGLVGVVSLILFWPFVGVYADMISSALAGQVADPELLLAEISGFIVYFLILLLPVMAIQLGVYTLWSRATLLGAQGAMEGGFRALANRALWVFWRLICGVGWGIVLVGALMLIVFGFTFIAGIAGSGTGGVFAGLMILLILPLYIGMIIALMMLNVLIAICIHAEARDTHLPIHQAYGLMKGNLLRAGGLYLLISLLFQMGATPVFFMALPASSASLSIASIAGLVVAFTVFSLFYFLWLSYGAEYTRRLLPQLNIGDVFK